MATNPGELWKWILQLKNIDAVPRGINICRMLWFCVKQLLIWTTNNCFGYCCLSVRKLSMQNCRIFLSYVRAVFFFYLLSTQNLKTNNTLKYTPMVTRSLCIRKRRNTKRWSAIETRANKVQESRPSQRQWSFLTGVIAITIVASLFRKVHGSVVKRGVRLYGCNFTHMSKIASAVPYNKVVDGSFVL